jgi:hypothetical protein
VCRLHRLYACAISTASRRLGRDTALCCAASGGHSAIIAALVFAGADGGVSNNSGYGKRRGSAWAQSPHAFGLGRHTAEKLAGAAGIWAEYEEAVRRVRKVRLLRLESFIALMLIRRRLPLMDTTGGGQHSALGVAVMALPSGLLAMVCEAMMRTVFYRHTRFASIPARCSRLGHRPARFSEAREQARCAA